MTCPHTLRPGVPADEPLVYDAWIKDYLPHSPITAVLGRRDAGLYVEAQHATIERVLSGAATRVLVACVTDAPDTILGVVVTEGPLLHWTFVKQAFRRAGIARALLRASGAHALYTTRTPLGERLLAACSPASVYCGILDPPASLLARHSRR